MDQQNTCPKCGGEMEEGVVADRGHNDAMRYPVWGTKIDKKLISFMAKVVDSKNVITFRCKNCGFLESFAK